MFPVQRSNQVVGKIRSAIAVGDDGEERCNGIRKKQVAIVEQCCQVIDDLRSWKSQPTCQKPRDFSKHDIRNERRFMIPCVVLLAVIGRCAVVQAQEQPPLVQQWQDLNRRERYEALQNYERHRELPRERREKVERQYERWQRMPEDEREHIRENYERYRSMPPRERSQVERNYRERKREPRE